MGFSKEDLNKTVELYKASKDFPGPLSLHGLQNNFWNQDYSVLRVVEEITLDLRDGEKMIIPKDILLFVGYRKGGSEKEKRSNLEVFLPENIKTALIQNNENQDFDALFAMQKAFVQNWEQENFYITTIDGKAAQVGNGILNKFQEALKNEEEEIPIIGNINWDLFFAANKLNSISFEAQSEEKRRNQKKIQKSIQLNLIKTANIRCEQIQKPWLTGIDFNDILPIYERNKKDRKIKYAKISFSGENFYIIEMKDDTFKINALKRFGIMSKAESESDEDIDLILLDSLSREEASELYKLCSKTIALKPFNNDTDMKILINDYEVPENFAIYKIMKDAAILLESLVYNGTKVSENVDNKPISTCLFSKFIINQENAKLVLKDELYNGMLVCYGCPFAIKPFLDYPYNGLIDPTLESYFFEDFKINYKNYFEIYPLLKKLAAYAMFIGISLHNYPTTTTIKKITRAAINGKQQDIGSLYFQKPANPLINLTFDWIYIDQIFRRYHFLNVLLNIQSPEFFECCTNKAEIHFTRKKIVIYSCLEILKSICISKIELTTGEKKLLQTMFSIDKNEFDEIVFSLAGIVIQLALKEGYISDVKSVVECLFSLMDKKEKEFKNKQNCSDLDSKNCWEILLSQHDWSTIQNSMEFVELLNKLMPAYFDITKRVEDRHILYSEFLHLMKILGQKRPSTLNVTKNNTLNIHENQKLLYLSALGYQAIPFLWKHMILKENETFQGFMSQFYQHISYYIRALSAILYILKNEEGINQLNWVNVAKYCTEEFQALLIYGLGEIKCFELNLKAQKLTKNEKVFDEAPNKKLGRKLVKHYSNQHFILKIGCDYELAAEKAMKISEIYFKLKDFKKAETWMERAKIDKIKAEEKLNKIKSNKSSTPETEKLTNYRENSPIFVATISFPIVEKVTTENSESSSVIATNDSSSSSQASGNLPNGFENQHHQITETNMTSPNVAEEEKLPDGFDRLMPVEAIEVLSPTISENLPEGLEKLMSIIIECRDCNEAVKMHSGPVSTYV